MDQSEQLSSHQQPAKPNIISSSSSSSSSSIVRASESSRNGLIERQKSVSLQQQERISRSRSRDRKRSRNDIQNEKSPNYLQQKNDERQERISQNQQKEVSQHLKLTKNASKVANAKEDKTKKKKVQRQYLTDFKQYLPQSLLIISRTNVTSKIRVGQRFQANVPKQPSYISQNRSLQAWKIWNGSSCPQSKPTEQNLWRFKQLLGENRNEEQLINIRTRMGNKSWREILQYVGNNKSELRRIFHNAQRNRLI